MDRAAYIGMSAIEDRHWWFVARRYVLGALISDCIGLHPASGARILEAGCGTGGNLALLSGFGQLQAFEFDDDARALAKAKCICPVEFGALPDRVNADAGSFDLVALLDVLEHIDDDVASLATLSGILAPNGKLLITVPAVPMLWSNHDAVHHHKRRYSRATLNKALASAGLNVERISYFNFFLFPLALVQRGWAKLANREEPLDSVPPSFVNSALTIIFAAERHLVGKMRFPIGLSLYAVASRKL